MYSDISNSLRTTIMARYVWQRSKNLEWNEHTKWEREKERRQKTHTHIYICGNGLRMMFQKTKRHLIGPTKKWNEMTCARNSNNHKSIAAFLSSYFEKKKMIKQKKNWKKIKSERTEGEFKTQDGKLSIDLNCIDIRLWKENFRKEKHKWQQFNDKLDKSHYWRVEEWPKFVQQKRQHEING